MERAKLLVELAELSAAFGPPGFEGEVAGLFQNMLQGIGRYSRDRLGSAVVELPGSGPRVMVAAHLDEVGFMIKAISAEGYLRFVPLGTWWTQVLLSGGVRVKGRLGEVRGVIGSKPPHFLNKKEHKELLPIEEMFIDIGAGSREAARAMGVAPGDPVVPDMAPTPLHGGEIMMGKALDDRVGVLAVIETARRLAGVEHPNAVLAVGTTQEEVGARGARTAAQMLHPDVCVIVEGTPADDGPGFARDSAQGALGQGPQIRMYDPSLVGNRALIDLVLTEALALGLPYQVAVREGGATDGGSVHLIDTGVPTMVIGIPVRYAHSQIGLCAMADLERTIDLLVSVVRRLDARTAAGI